MVEFFGETTAPRARGGFFDVDAAIQMVSSSLQASIS
jgi:hypothetical protein